MKIKSKISFLFVSLIVFFLFICFLFFATRDLHISRRWFNELVAPLWSEQSRSVDVVGASFDGDGVTVTATLPALSALFAYT